MSGDRSDKRFDATATRKQKAKREGNVARSTEISGIAAFGCATLATFAVLPGIGANAASALALVSRDPNLARLAPTCFVMLALALAPAAAAAAGATGAAALQTGGLTLTVPKWQLTRLHPVTGIKRMIGGEAVVSAMRAVVAFTVAGLTMWPLALDIFARATVLDSTVGFAVLVQQGAQRACVAALVTGGCFAVADFGLTRRRWLRELKMTLEEMKRDQKENDGDPHTRSRRKQLHRSLVRGSLQQTKDASFVVVNPSHIAIAIRYAPPDVPVPEVLVRAADEMALAVKALARAHAIPIVENVALARALYAHGEAGRSIPSETFVAVARVIAELVREGVIT